ncbi:MAG: hypothetical protein UT50_C0013G0008 [Candidatus Moranbacteria bacterium GW2011_GWA2_39_41]|nr:MAG: hypothetical protein UT50_C0013G0008 [Candidatus Moranbacteria bacterium GW2011_GWA2_39_41]
MENNNKKEITLEAIAELINAGNAETTKSLEAKIISSAAETRKILEAKIESAVDNLAIITNNNFVKLEADIKAVKSDLDVVKADLGVVKSDVEEIKTNMNKKVDIFKHNDLVYRVEKLEEKNGIVVLNTATV